MDAANDAEVLAQILRDEAVVSLNPSGTFFELAGEAAEVFRAQRNAQEGEAVRAHLQGGAL